MPFSVLVGEEFTTARKKVATARAHIFICDNQMIIDISSPLLCLVNLFEFFFVAFNTVQVIS